jgi:hypothetical protein
VLTEASDLLTLQNIPHAAIDLDALGFGHLPAQPPANDLMFRNLRSVWEHYAGAGVRRVLLARALETRAELDSCHEAVSAANVVICRLTSSLKTMQQRVQFREPGTLQNTFVARVAELNAALDQAALETFSVQNENRPIAAVAREMLTRAAWLTP